MAISPKRNPPVKLEPHAPYRIVWVDAFCSPLPWQTREDLMYSVKEEHREGCDTVGFYVGKVGRHLIFASGIGRAENPTTYFQGFAIPRAWIKSIVKIEPQVKKLTKKKLPAK